MQADEFVNETLETFAGRMMPQSAAPSIAGFTILNLPRLSQDDRSSGQVCCEAVRKKYTSARIRPSISPRVCRQRQNSRELPAELTQVVQQNGARPLGPSSQNLAGISLRSRLFCAGLHWGAIDGHKLGRQSKPRTKSAWCEVNVDASSEAERVYQGVFNGSVI